MIKTNGIIEKYTNKDMSETQGAPARGSKGGVSDENNIAQYNIILGNLPTQFTITDITYLVEEVNPLYISCIRETKLLKLRFCKIGLSEQDDLIYLINKLDKFIIKGSKLIAVDLDKCLSLQKSFEL